MNLVTRGRGGSINLQATLSASSALGTGDATVFPHHPITCAGTLRLDTDGALSCEHASAPPDDVRTQCCIDHSVALLLIELSREL